MRYSLVQAVLLMACLTIPVRGQLTEDVIALDGVGIDEKLDARLPLDLVFRDSGGKSIRLGDLFDGQRPVILSLNYSDCPMLCQLQLNGLVDGMRDLSWSPDADFQIVSLSIDPLETSTRAQQTKQQYVRAYGRPESATGWHFLTGDKVSIARLADSVGFRFAYIPDRHEYAHAAVLMVCTPQGRISRYLYGVLFPAQTLKLALVEAGEGKIGSTLDHMLLFCFHYDATSGRYAPTARQIMKLAAGFTLTAVLTCLLPIWLRRHHVHRKVAHHAVTGGA